MMNRWRLGTTAIAASIGLLVGTAAGATPIINWVLSFGGSANYIDVTRREKEVHREPERLGLGWWLTTLEGSVFASKGDWVIRGVQDEFYPCKDVIFMETYEQVH